VIWNTRSDNSFKAFSKEVGLGIIAIKLQKGYPKELLSVRVYEVYKGVMKQGTMPIRVEDTRGETGTSSDSAFDDSSVDEALELVASATASEARPAFPSKRPHPRIRQMLGSGRPAAPERP